MAPWFIRQSALCGLDVEPPTLALGVSITSISYLTLTRLLKLS